MGCGRSYCQDEERDRRGRLRPIAQAKCGFVLIYSLKIVALFLVALAFTRLSLNRSMNRFEMSHCPMFLVGVARILPLPVLSSRKDISPSDLVLRLHLPRTTPSVEGSYLLRDLPGRWQFAVSSAGLAVGGRTGK